ncbi:response regulator receiver modulated diguanylate cyclase [Humitalea rosea]|uniref:diguanylate cyclase n=1 Tax=Humitalea rosea TaxID=990373 RepID=A0A2W7J9Z5_9PROT|nr:diguanylate cyclase [Humitalea rosea]PZW48262.1 response regulator receiver modulated diguanylate cyclase [Humitalea rosea]
MISTRSLILIVDDELANVEILSAALEDSYEICFATSGEDAMTVARAELPDLILLDVLMSGMDGYEVCRQLKADPTMADVPIIFTTALNDQAAEVHGLELGAIDYVTKPISPAIVQARVRNHLELKRMRDELARLAVTDALTGLGNRRRLETTLAHEAARLARASAELSIILLDIDFFKRFNDNYGHNAGDRCITMVAATLNRAIRRASHLAARFGGEEFACVLPGVSHAEAMEVAYNIRDRIQALGIPHERSDVAPFVTVSVGVATATCRAGIDPENWIRAADSQLYLSKSAGRNTVSGQFFDEQALLAAWGPTAPTLNT